MGTEPQIEAGNHGGAGKKAGNREIAKKGRKWVKCCKGLRTGQALQKRVDIWDDAREKDREREHHKKGAGNMDGSGNKDSKRGWYHKKFREQEMRHKKSQGTGAVPQKMAGNGDGVAKKGLERGRRRKKAGNDDGAAKRQGMVMELQNKDMKEEWLKKRELTFNETEGTAGKTPR